MNQLYFASDFTWYLYFRAIQFLNRCWILVIWLFIFCWLEGFAINGMVPAGIPSIERQFQLTSAKSSLIPASQDFGALFVILFVSFIGGRYNKPKLIAIGSLIMALGSFIFTIPHIVQRYEWGKCMANDLYQYMRIFITDTVFDIFFSKTYLKAYLNLQTKSNIKYSRAHIPRPLPSEICCTNFLILAYWR